MRFLALASLGLLKFPQRQYLVAAPTRPVEQLVRIRLAVQRSTTQTIHIQVDQAPVHVPSLAAIHMAAIHIHRRGRMVLVTTTLTESAQETLTPIRMVTTVAVAATQIRTVPAVRIASFIAPEII